ncbi:MAG: N-acetylmuramoyl-L-alanine amidase [Spirochaetota bacterium]
MLIILFIFIPAMLSSSSATGKTLKIIGFNNNSYISMYEFTHAMAIHNSFDIITGKGKLVHRGAIAVYQADLSVMLINNKLIKSHYSVIRNQGEILLPLKFFEIVIEEFYPDYLQKKESNLIYLNKRNESEFITSKIPEKKKKAEERVSSDSDKISFIIIDPGHGGKDPGAIGKGGLKEKWITLKIAAQVEEYLKTKLKKVSIRSTRKSDKFIELSERTNIANRMLKKNINGIFISIHVNASILHSVSGFETYFLSQNPSNEEARATAALENNVIIFEENLKRKSYNDVQHVEAIMLTTQIQKESSILANSIQGNMKKDIRESSSKGVKKADFFVLRDSLMPAVLVEVGYISNQKEAANLKKTNYQQKIAEGIGNGIIEFIKEYNKNIKK